MLYKLFGVNAELLIDHAWGYEPVTLEQIKSYKPRTNSISSGQVLHCPYNYEDTKLIVKEMTELLTLDLVSKRLVTNQIVLTIGYDIENLKDYNLKNLYRGEVTTDRYGRKVPKHAHGTINLDHKTSSTKTITKAVMELYERIMDKRLLARRIYVVANNVIDEETVEKEKLYEQIDFFSDYKRKEEEVKNEKKEKNLQKAMIDIKNKYGKNAILKGMNLQEAGTTIDRNSQIGGHRS